MHADSGGIEYGISLSRLVAMGYELCYDQPYSAFTTEDELNSCKGKSNAFFVGAKNSSDSLFFFLGAFGTSGIFNLTTAIDTAYLDPLGAYWYNVPEYGFGFANTSSVYLYDCDTGDGPYDCSSRLCWHLTGRDGGYRAGCKVDLNWDNDWRKVIYKYNKPSLSPSTSPKYGKWKYMCIIFYYNEILSRCCLEL